MQPSNTGLPDWISQASGQIALHIARHVEHQLQLVETAQAQPAVVVAMPGGQLTDGPLMVVALDGGGVDHEIGIPQRGRAVGGVLEA